METYLWHGRPATRRYFLNAQILGLLLLAAASIAAGKWINGMVTTASARHIWVGVAVLWGIFLAALALYRYVAYRSLEFLVRPHGIEVRSGIWVRDQKTVPWNQLRSVELQRTLMDRVMGTGSIHFSTGDLTQTRLKNRPGYDCLESISDAESVYELIQEAMSKAGGADRRPVL